MYYYICLNNHRYLKLAYLPFDFLIPRFLDIPGPRFDILIILKDLGQQFLLQFFFEKSSINKTSTFLFIGILLIHFKYKFFRIICWYNNTYNWIYFTFHFFLLCNTFI